MQHRFHVNASSDDDFRSSRNIAISLFKRYKNVIDRGSGDNLKVWILVWIFTIHICINLYALTNNYCDYQCYQEFISAGVNAYALGCTDEGLRKELMDIEYSGLEIEGLGSCGGNRLKFKVHSFEVSILQLIWIASFNLPSLFNIVYCLPVCLTFTLYAL